MRGAPRCARRGVLLALALAACEGSGSAGGGLEIRNEPAAPNCTGAGQDFPSGLALLAQGPGLAAMAQTQPRGVITYELGAERPIARRFQGTGDDSDRDGRDDGAAMKEVLDPTFVPASALQPVMGGIRALRDDLALVSTSTYEQVLVYDPAVPTLQSVAVETPASFSPERFPLLPPPGTAHLRTGISTLACVTPDDPTDSQGDAIEADPACGGSDPSYLTTLTAGKAVAGGRLFVATSNLSPTGGSRFFPGTVLVYEWNEAGGLVTVGPDAAEPILFTTAFNPTGVTRHVTPSGRELVLVTLTGAIGTGSGPDNVLTEAAIDVIDPRVPRIAARIPLGFAGPSFEGLAVEPSGRVGWLGASSERQIYAVDLRPLDDPDLYTSSGPPATLDEAAIFDGARPFVLPDRPDGAPPRDCDGFTHVATETGGREVYATDFCDGTFTRVRMELGGDPPIPYPADRFRVGEQSTPFAPNDALGELRSPGQLAVRPGTPIVDFTSPDVFILAGQPDAQICALRVKSF